MERQDKSTTLTAFKEFVGRSHDIAGQPGWEEVADYALDCTATGEAADASELRLRF